MRLSDLTAPYIEDYRPHGKTRKLLDDVRSGLQEYRQHWPLSVRQVFYRLVGAHGYPKSELFYKNLCEHMANARRARVISFSAIRDDGVSVIEEEHFADKDAFYERVREIGADYTRDKMAAQDYYVEVWCEAAGMQPQLATVANEYSISVYSSSGFDSLSAKYRIAQRICDVAKPAIILHLGDYDPSGASILNAPAEDVRAFVVPDRYDARADVEFRRVALTEAQVADYNLPTAAPKASDSRTKAWGTKGTCQLEALAPDQIAELLDGAINDLTDPDQFKRQPRGSRRRRGHHRRRRGRREARTSPGGS